MALAGATSWLLYSTFENRLDFFSHYMYYMYLYLLSFFSRSFLYLLPGEDLVQIFAPVVQPKGVKTICALKHIISHIITHHSVLGRC